MTTINAPRELLAQWLGMFEGGIASNPLSALRERTRGYLQSEQPQKYDDTLLPFLALMRAELHANSHKGDREGWLGMSTESALCEIEYHLSKLRHAVHSADGPLVREHAADVANCAMMLADIAGVLSRE